MRDLTAQREYERAAGLRQAALELLEIHLQRDRSDCDPDTVTALQEAANRLGAAERRLLEKLSASRNGERSNHGPHQSTAPNRAAPTLPTSRAAAITLALAETLVPLAPSRADEAERWLRIMREHGQLGDALQALGMASGELSTPATEPRRSEEDRLDPVRMVADDAARFAHDRNAATVSTVDLLFAVFLHYGSLFDRALYAATSKTRNDLLAALALDHPARVG